MESSKPIDGIVSDVILDDDDFVVVIRGDEVTHYVDSGQGRVARWDEITLLNN